MNYSDTEQYWIWLAGIEGLGPVRFAELMELYEDPQQVWQSVGKDSRLQQMLGAKTYARLHKARNEEYLYKIFARMEQLGIRAVPRTHKDYPFRLSQIYDPPAVLFVKGDGDLASEKMLGIVGTRTPTHDGKRAAHQIACKLSEQGVTVVSGLARGVDTCAHGGCIEGGAPTIAVIGCGLDVVYPPENAALYEQILAEGGALVSEYMPGSRPRSAHFPARNRIISGLCSGVLIVEAAKGSGAMITARLALEQDRDLFVVPGSIYSALSYEPNRLLVEGAIPVLDEKQVLDHYRWEYGGMTAEKSPDPELSKEESSIVNPLKSEMLSYDELWEITKIPPSRLNSLLTTLELRGIISKVPGGLFRANG